MGHDLVITGGTVVDGTGAPGMSADVAIDGDRVTDVGTVDTTAATRVVDAEGRYVTPGFVDLHTHLDAQVGWDSLLTSSCWHGVTSIVMGNCGVTFAPVRPRDHGYLAEMMESVEDIPASSIVDGLPWDWETYGDYLASLDRMPKGINAGGLIGHCALRYYAMGERSVDEGEDPTDEQLALMTELVDEAMRAGALGFSSSRSGRHHVPDGRSVPGTFAHAPELAAIADVLGRHGRGMIECAPRFDGEGPSEPRVDDELEWMESVSRASRRPVTFSVTQTREQGTHYRHALAAATSANERGARIRPQTTPRGIGVLFCLDTMTPFDGTPEWRSLKEVAPGERLEAVRARRDELIGIAHEPAMLERFYVLTPEQGARYDCRPEDALPAVAAARGVSPVEAYVDLLLETDGLVIVSWPILNQDLAAVGEMLDDRNVLMGLADSGAHVGQILDASQPTSFLLHWVRDQGRFSFEEGVRRLTSDTARFAGIPDRGVLRPGVYADVNVIDFDAMFLPVPEYVYDFPGGAGRFVQRARGYDTSIVNGEVFLEAGEHTGAFPGRVLRGA